MSDTHLSSVSDDETAIVASTTIKRIHEEINSRDKAYISVITGPDIGRRYNIGDGALMLGRAENMDIRIIDGGISREHARFYYLNGQIILEDLNSINGTFLNSKRLDEAEPLRDGDRIAVGNSTALKFSMYGNLDIQYQQAIDAELLRDDLTKAYNKKYFTRQLLNEFSYSRRRSTPLCVILVDIDFFKRVNDTYGHLAGDHVLTHLSGQLLDSIRGQDILARYGGEEFAVICRGLTIHQGMGLGERIRSRVEFARFQYDGSHIPVTASVGVASIPEIVVESAEKLIKAADIALYQAKGDGRNCVIAAKAV